MWHRPRPEEANRLHRPHSSSSRVRLSRGAAHLSRVALGRPRRIIPSSSNNRGRARRLSLV